MRPNLLCSALPLAFAVRAARAFADDAGVAAALETITVSATRTERAVEEVPASVTVIGRERMDRELVWTLKDLFRYEPGVSVTSAYGRFGIGDIRIRGLGGNRVRIETDGIAVSDAFAIGSFSNANRNFVDLDTLKRVEVVRGPASALYGSDALGGVVSFVTKDPADYLEPGEASRFGLKLGYDSADDAWHASSTAAFGSERWSALFAVGRREGHEIDNQGANASDGAARTAPNPQDARGSSVLGKLLFSPSPEQRFKLTLEGTEQHVDTDVRSLRGSAVTAPGAPAVRVASMLGDDLQARARLSFAHEHDALGLPFADSIEWQLYRQDSETTQRTREVRANVSNGTLVNPVRRQREFNFDQRIHGLEATLHKEFATGSVEQALTYGLEYSSTDIAQKRDGRATNLTSGAVTSSIPPDVFPVRDFPKSTTRIGAIFVQDEIAVAEGALRIVPGIRVDRYRLDPHPDAIFRGDNPAITPRGLEETSISPKLGVVYRLADDWSVFGGYQHGFRAPPYNDVNIGFTNLQFGYTAIPNPDLEPEESNGYELGLRHSASVVHAEAVAYYNRYDDFIESMRVVSAPTAPVRVFQSQNVTEATIRGIELRGHAELGRIAEALDGWSVRAALAWSKGQDESAHRPIATIDPRRASLGVAYERETWGAELVGRFAGRKRDLAQADQFAPPGYGAFDLLGHWAFATGDELVVGVFNLADKTYWDWADVPGVVSTSPSLDRYTRPGRSVGVSLNLNW